MQQFVAIVNPHTIWTQHRAAMTQVLDTPGLTGIDLRWSLAGEMGAKDRNIASLNMIRAARDRGLVVRMHGWVGANAAISPTLARAQAQQAAQICTAEGVQAWGINAEKDVWRHGQAAAVDFLDVYLDTFYETGRRTHAAYLGFVYPPMYYGRGTAIPPEHKRRYHECWQMIYQTTRPAVLDKIQLGQREWPNHAKNYYIGVGRIDEKGAVIGAWPVWSTLKGPHTALTWYVGNGRAAEQLAVGNPKHPPLTRAIPQIAGLAPGC